jgi:hypothetical protein
MQRRPGHCICIEFLWRDHEVNVKSRSSNGREVYHSRSPGTVPGARFRIPRDNLSRVSFRPCGSGTELSIQSARLGPTLRSEDQARTRGREAEWK